MQCITYLYQLRSVSLSRARARGAQSEDRAGSYSSSRTPATAELSVCLSQRLGQWNARQTKTRRRRQHSAQRRRYWGAKKHGSQKALITQALASVIMVCRPLPDRARNAPERARPTLNRQLDRGPRSRNPGRPAVPLAGNQEKKNKSLRTWGTVLESSCSLGKLFY